MLKLVQGLEGLATLCCGKLQRESQRVGRFIEHNIRRMLALWIGFAGLGGGAKILQLVDRHPRAATFERLVPLGVGYALIACAPLAGFLLVQKCYPRGAAHAQPRIRLARLGTWTDLERHRPVQTEATGISGLTVSVVAGLLLCMAMRLGEYCLAVPAIPPGAASWATTYFWMMTFDLGFLAFLYSIAIAMAINSAPLFPRMLAYAWLCDVLMQLAIARAMVNSGSLPPEIVAPLEAFLAINIKKVLISAAIWLPYLLLSAHINATFRNRARQPGPLLPGFARI